MATRIYLALLLCLFISLTPAQAQWSQTKGPLGRHFFDMMENNDRIWGAAIGGLFYSDDEGESWNRHPAISYDDYVYSIGKYKDKLFTVVERGGADDTAPFENSLLSSSDDGISWQLTGALPSIGAWVQVFIHNDQLILTGGYNPRVSTDHGLSWPLIPLPLPANNSPLYLFDSTTFVVWYYQKGIFASQDIGQNWTVVADSAAEFELVSGVRGNEIIARKKVPAPVYAAYYYSQNLGQTWALLSDPLPDTIFTSSYQFWGTDTILATNSGFFGQNKISLDGGLSWQPWTEWGTNGFLPKIITTDGGINGEAVKYYAASGITETKNTGLINENIQDVKSNGTMLFASTSAGDYFSSSDKGDTWEQLPLKKLLGAAGQMAVSGDTVYACSNYGVFYSINNGQSSWDTLGFGALNYQIKELRVSGDYLIGETHHKPFIINRFTGQYMLFGTAPSVECSFYILGSRYVLADKNAQRVWISDTQGQNWVPVLTEIGNINSRLFYLKERLFLFSINALYFSTNTGSSWSKIYPLGLPVFSSNWPDSYALPGEAVAVGQTIYVTIPNYGVYKSDDLGANWSPFNESLGALRNNCLMEHNGNLFLGTPTSSVWRTDLTNSPVFTPHDPEKLHIAPNPSTGQFSLQLPDATPTELWCYDVLGNLVWQKKVPGGSTVLDLGDCPRGVYQLLAISAGKLRVGSVVLE